MKEKEKGRYWRIGSPEQGLKKRTSNKVSSRPYIHTFDIRRGSIRGLNLQIKFVHPLFGLYVFLPIEYDDYYPVHRYIYPSEILESSTFHFRCTKSRDIRHHFVTVLSKWASLQRLGTFSSSDKAYAPKSRILKPHVRISLSILTHVQGGRIINKNQIYNFTLNSEPDYQ